MVVARKHKKNLSLEVDRLRVHNFLKEYFEFESPTQEIDFLLRHQRILLLLPFCAEFIRASFDEDLRLRLRLLNEGKSWQTLFIQFDAHCDWEKYKSFTDSFYDHIIAEFLVESKKLNIDLNPL
ncbi:MAG TPA: hypothetical protein VIU12_27785 [Chryseolinea sp.]